MKVLLITLVSISKCVGSLLHDHRNCTSIEDLFDQQSYAQVEFFKKACINKHDKVIMSCFSTNHKTQNLACGLTVSTGVIRHGARVIRPLMCSCDSLCRFHGDCCPDFASACPAEAEMAMKFEQITVENLLGGPSAKLRVIHYCFPPFFYPLLYHDFVSLLLL